MRVERTKGAVLLEAGMFAAMAGAVGMVAFIVLGGYGFISGVMFGGAVFVVVFAIMWILMGATMEPPRGPGNIRVTDTPLTRRTESDADASVARSAPAASQSASAADGEPASHAEMSKPPLLDGPRDGGKDDLKQIRGVGPKLEDSLNEIGIYHFEQIAAWSPQEVAWADEHLVGFKGRVSRDDWVSQAKALMDGTAPA